MHASSLENMQKCYQRFLPRTRFLLKPGLRVVDIGGQNVNGSYADIFSDDQFDYLAVDLQAGPGVDVVLDDPYRLPFDSGAVDIVISGQAFEHVEFFWKLFEEMMRVLSPDGLIFLIAPSAGPIHRYPVDCYRFYPDSMAALARYTGATLVDCWLDNRGPWNDLVGVFAHSEAALQAVEVSVSLPSNRYLEQTSVTPLFNHDGAPEVEVVGGRGPYLETLRQVHEQLQPRFYLEIGVRRGSSLELAACPALGIDPEPDLAAEPALHHRLCRKTSDAFFEQDAPSFLAGQKMDLVFIDGMHLFEFALRDFMNAEQYALPGTLIVIDDIYPNHPLQAERRRQSRVWTGDIWKLHDCLKSERPDLVMIAVDTAPSGLLMVAGLNPANRTLLEHYNPLVTKVQGYEH